MKKLSEIIYEKEFERSESKGFLRTDTGYNPAQVDLFLEQIGPAAEQLEKENLRLNEMISKYELEIENLKNSTPVENEISEQRVSNFEKEKENVVERIMEETVYNDNNEEVLNRKMKQIENIEKSYRKILFAAEEEGEAIRSEAKKESTKMIFETQQKSEMLLKQVNLKCEEQERKYLQLVEKENLIKNELIKIADYIHNEAKPVQYNNRIKSDYSDNAVGANEM